MLIAGNMVLFNKKATLSTRYKLKVLDHFQDFFPFIYLFFPHVSPSTLTALLPLCLANSFWSNRTQFRRSSASRKSSTSRKSSLMLHHTLLCFPHYPISTGPVQVEPPMDTSSIADLLVDFSHWAVRSSRESTVAHSPL